MEKTKYRFVVVGAGVSGLTTAYKLSEEHPGEVLILERDGRVGGLCQTIRKEGSSYDIGSHRIHWNPRRKAFDLMKDISGEKLVKKSRGGKLRIKRSYINYPPTSVQMFFGLGFIESFLCAASLIKGRVFNKLFGKSAKPDVPNYKSYILRKAGRRAYKLFYEPYALKVWGQDPALISITAVKKRISMIKPARFLKDIMANYLKRYNRSFYYYFEGGIGRFPEGLEKKILDNGCRIVLGVKDFSINLEGERRSISFIDGEKENNIEFDIMISTIAVDDLALKLSPDSETREAVGDLKWRGLRVAYLQIKGDPKLEGETFYFPELKFTFSRVSIPKRFSGEMQPESGYTCFVCEIPCGEEAEIYKCTDKDVFDLCMAGLREAKLISEDQENIKEKSFTVSISKVYPLYLVGWKENLSTLLEHLAKCFPYIYSSGKLGFFMHCNLDHSIDIGRLLAEHIKNGRTVEEWYSKVNFFQNLKLRD